MPLAGTVILIVLALIAVVVAVFLVRIALYLRQVSFNLGTIVAGLRAMADQTEPLQTTVQDINDNLSDAERRMQEVVAKAQGRGQRIDPDAPPSAQPQPGEASRQDTPRQRPPSASKDNPARGNGPPHGASNGSTPKPGRRKRGRGPWRRRR